MSQSERCKTCKHWTPFTTEYPKTIARNDEKSGGICGNEKMTEDYGSGHGADMLIYPYAEGGYFWTGPEFGCVHHAGAEGGE